VGFTGEFGVLLENLAFLDVEILLAGKKRLEVVRDDSDEGTRWFVTFGEDDLEDVGLKVSQLNGGSVERKVVQLVVRAVDLCHQRVVREEIYLWFVERMVGEEVKFSALERTGSVDCSDYRGCEERDIEEFTLSLKKSEKHVFQPGDEILFQIRSSAKTIKVVGLKSVTSDGVLADLRKHNKTSIEHFGNVANISLLIESVDSFLLRVEGEFETEKDQRTLEESENQDSGHRFSQSAAIYIRDPSLTVRDHTGPLFIVVAIALSVTLITIVGVILYVIAKREKKRDLERKGLIEVEINDFQPILPTEVEDDSARKSKPDELQKQPDFSFSAK